MSAQTNLPTAENRRGAFRLLFFSLMAVGAGNTMLITTVLPLLVRELAFPAWTAGAIFSLSALAWVLFSPFWGQMSNRYGRRPIAAMGMMGFAASMLLFGLAGTAGLVGLITSWPIVFVMLLSGRSLFGIFGSGTNPAAQAYVADRTDAANRTEEIATLTAGFTLGTVLGPALAAVLIERIALLAPVFAIAALAAGMGLSIWFFLPENREPRIKKIVSREEKGLWRDPGLAPYLIYGIGLSLVSGILVQTFPFFMLDRLTETGYFPVQTDPDAKPAGTGELGIVMTLGAMATLMAQIALIPRLKLSARALMATGAIMIAVASGLILTAPSIAVFALVQILFGMGQGFSRPGFTSGASLAVGATLQGNVAGLVTAANGVGFVVSPLFGLWAYEHIHPYAPFIFAALVMAFMGGFAFWKATAIYRDPEGDAHTEVEEPTE